MKSSSSVTSKTIRSVAADSNVLLSAVAGKAARKVFDKAPELTVVTTEDNFAEVEEYLPEFAKRYSLEIEFLLETLELFPVDRYSESDYITHLNAARRYVAHRDPDDVPLAALALKLDIPIWSNDNDYEDVPLDVYPTAKLLKILGI